MTTTSSRRPTDSCRRALVHALGIACVPLCWSPSRGVAQAAQAIEEGSRVRITAPSLGFTKAVGTVQATTNGQVIIEFEDPRRFATVRRSDITAMDVSSRRGSRAGLGLGIGMLVGVASGVAIGHASGDTNSFLWPSAGDKAQALGLALGLVGSVVGLTVGGNSRHDVWSTTSPADLGLGLLPLVRDGHAGVQLSVAVGIR